VFFGIRVNAGHRDLLAITEYFNFVYLAVPIPNLSNNLSE
jgi:hypothetical protein